MGWGGGSNTSVQEKGAHCALRKKRTGKVWSSTKRIDIQGDGETCGTWGTAWMDASLPPVGAPPKEVLMILFGVSIVINCLLGCLVLYLLLLDSNPKRLFVSLEAL